jgi:hypothetical protein
MYDTIHDQFLPIECHALISQFALSDFPKPTGFYFGQIYRGVRKVQVLF